MVGLSCGLQLDLDISVTPYTLTQSANPNKLPVCLTLFYHAGNYKLAVDSISLHNARMRSAHYKICTWKSGHRRLHVEKNRVKTHHQELFMGSTL